MIPFIRIRESSARTRFGIVKILAVEALLRTPFVAQYIHGIFIAGRNMVCRHSRAVTMAIITENKDIDSLEADITLLNVYVHPQDDVIRVKNISLALCIRLLFEGLPKRQTWFDVNKLDFL